MDVLCRMAYYLDIDVTLTDKIRGLLKNPDALTMVISNVSHGEKLPSQAHFSRDGKWFAGHDSYYFTALADDGSRCL